MFGMYIRCALYQPTNLAGEPPPPQTLKTTMFVFLTFLTPFLLLGMLRIAATAPTY